MTIQQAVKDTLAADPAIVRIEPRAELPIGRIAPISDKPLSLEDTITKYGNWTTQVKDAPPPQRGTELCRCCATQTATRDGRCFECDAHTAELRGILAKCLHFLTTPELVDYAEFNSMADDLVANIKEALGDD